MERAAVFAHYSKNNKIEEYVIYYLKELNKFVKNIIFVSDCSLDEKQQNKIKDYTYKIIAQRHGEYDFGSYKRGYQYLQENNLLNNIDELIFANDSCYAPLYPFDDMFNTMSNRKCDFWGATANSRGLKRGGIPYLDIDFYHIQSYFLVFKPSVFNNNLFKDFINSVKHEANKVEVVIEYELGLSKLLLDNGFISDAYSESSKTYLKTYDDRYKELILQEKSPFLKRNLVLCNSFPPKIIFHLKEIINQTNYDYNIILKDRIKYTNIKNIIKIYKKNKFRLSLKEKKLILFNHTYYFGRKK